MKAANLALRFLLELCALAALAYWGAHAGRGGASRVLLAVAAPLALAVLWGLLVAPRSAVRVPPAMKWLLGLTLLEASAYALGRSGRPTLAMAFAAVAAVNAVLLLLWRQ